jgi:hypothetical protein
MEPGRINEDVIDQHVIARASAGSHSGSHAYRELLPDGPGHDRRIVHPCEALGGVRAVLHPPLVDCVPESVDAEAHPGLV